MHKTLESLEKIESQKSLSNLSPLKPPSHAKNLPIVEEEEKNEIIFTVKGKKFKEEKVEEKESEDQLALVLFQLKNEEQLEYKPLEKK